MNRSARRDNDIRRQVLIVDDEPVNQQLLGYIVSNDYDVLYAGNGVEALDMIRKNGKLISLILLDLLMPEMDGYELLEILHSDPDLKWIPVIVLTSEKSAEVRSLQLGAADFIPKPYDLPDVILARIHRSIELAEDHTIIRETETDNLTGLYTRAFFFQYCIQNDLYNPDIRMDAIVIDINRFHLINELYGRDYGDQILKAIAENILDLVSDIGGLAGRYEADTFCIYVPHISSFERFFDDYIRQFEERLENSRISLRVGIYENVSTSIDMEQRFDRANIACTSCRSTYSSSFAVYDTKLHERELYNERLLSDMDSALESGQFVVYFQPKYDITGDRPRLNSAEALIRWIHPELGMISPGAFIPLFEENGLIQKLDRFVWKKAAAQIGMWKEQYGITVPVSVNISRIDIYDPHLEEELLEITSSCGLKPSEYLLEITESAYTDNSDQIISTVERLRKDGFCVEMDDFGSGYSSLNMLSALPIDALKLDMCFIRNICENEKDLKMVELILGIAAFLNVPAIAEGVETKQQCELLKKAGCDIIQGYYFSRPVPADEFGRLIETQLKEDSAC